MRVAIAVAAFTLLLGAPSAASDLTPQEQSIIANVLAIEFNAVCVQTSGELESVRTIAASRGWKPRPVEITASDLEVPSYAWDGEVKFIPIARSLGRDRYSFAAAIYPDRFGGSSCEFIFEDAFVIDALAGALKNLGFYETFRGDWGDGRVVASFEVSSSDDECHSFVRAEARVVLDRPWLTGSRLMQQCIIRIDDRFVFRPKPAEMEPWLGQKQPRPGALLDPVD